MDMELGEFSLLFLQIYHLQFDNIYSFEYFIYITITLMFRYMIQDKKLGTIVTSYKSNSNASEYVKCLEKAFKDIHSIMVYGK